MNKRWVKIRTALLLAFSVLLSSLLLAGRLGIILFILLSRGKLTNRIGDQS